MVQVERVVAVEFATRRGSGYVIAPRLLLTSAHATPDVGRPVTVFALADPGQWSGRVVWRGEPGGRDDAALVEIDDPTWRPRDGTVQWGRVVTNRPGTACHAWGFPRWVQRTNRVTDSWQPSGTLNPGNRYVGDRYVLSLDSAAPAPTLEAGSPWGGLSGAALFCGDLLTGVVATDPAGGRHAHLETVPGYVLHRDDGFRRTLAGHGLIDPALEPVELQNLAQAEPPGGASPAALLRARRHIVGFRGRRELLGELLTWSQAPGFAAWLLHGPAGQGKTRLGQELAHRLAERRWAWLWLRGDTPTDTLTVLADVAVPLLTIVDYAETRPDQIVKVLRAVARHGGDVPLRMLLLARTTGDWWEGLRASDPHTEALLADSAEKPLPELETRPAGRAAAYRQAVTDLSRALADLPGYRHHDWPVIAKGIAAQGRGADQPGSALALQMTALANLLDVATPSDGPPGARTELVEDRLLYHERRYWQSTAAARGLCPPLAETSLLDALATAMLLGADSRDDADRLLQHLPCLHDQTHDRRATVRNWIAGLYPADDARPWGRMQPDRLTERFVGNRLLQNPTLVDPLLANASTAQLSQLLTVYARAAHHHAFASSLDTQLRDLCIRHADVLAIPAIDTATRVEAPGPLIAALRHLTTSPGTTLDTLTAMTSGSPRTSRNLADWAVELAERLVNEHRRRAAAQPDTYLPVLAMSLNNLSVRLGDVGRRENGLAASREAVAIYRELTRTRGDQFRPDLAMSLTNLSADLGDLGHMKEGLAAIDEAVTILRDLAATDPDRFLPDLATSMNNLSVSLSDLGRRDDGLAASREAVAIYRKLADTLPEFVPNLATALNNLSGDLGDLGRSEDGLAASEEAVAIHRNLARTNPDAFLPDLAMSLTSLALRMGHQERRTDATAAITEAIAIRRDLATRWPDVHQTDLENSESVLAWLHDDESQQQQQLHED